MTSRKVWRLLLAAAIILTVMILPCGSSVFAANFADNFDDGNYNGWTTYGGTWSVVSGQLNVNSGAGFKAIANGTSCHSFTYQASVSVGASGNAGLIFRVSSPTVGTDSLYGYYAGIDAANDRVQVGKFSNNWTEMAYIPYTINPDTMYTIKVIQAGRNIDVYVNNTWVISAVDTTHSSAGAIGVRTFNTAAKFDNISVTDNGTVSNPTYNWSWVKGAVFVPTNVVNECQQWQEYNSAINDRELYYCKIYGINLVRVYLHFLVWQNNKTKFLGDIENFLQLANKHGIKVEFVFFDDCWNDYPTLAPYPAPLFGVHNSRWVECPGDTIKGSYASYKASLKSYVQDVVNAHLNDSRISFWEPYNEPGNGESGVMFDVTNQILNDSRIWIRETGSTIPITSCEFAGTKAPFTSDFYTFHAYDSGYSGPRGSNVLNTECMNRSSQSVPGVDNAYYHQGTGYTMWEAGIGRDNCRYPWGDTTTEPTAPFHGVIYPDGHPWSLADVQAIRNDDLSTIPVFNVEYYAANNFTNLKKTSITPMIDFDLGNEFGTGSPDASVGIGVDNFSTRWTGIVTPASTGTYTFYADGDNIIRVWVGGAQVINKTGGGRSEVSGSISLTANTNYNFKVEYVHATGDASLHIKWAGPNLAKQVLLGKRGTATQTYVRWESHNLTGNFIRHQDGRGKIASSITPAEDAQWIMVPGLADSSCVSFESVNFPGSFLRHRYGEIWMDANDGSAIFKADATWRKVSGLANSSGVSFESYNFPGEYIRHRDWLLWRTTIVSDLDKADATFYQR